MISVRAAPKRRISGKGIKRAVTQITGLIISAVILIPFLMIVLNSMKTHAAANRLKLNFDGISLAQTAQNYRSVFQEANLLSSLWNSFVVTTVSSVIIVAFASLAAFVVVRRRTKAMRVVNNLIVSGLTLPAAMVPIYFLFSRIGMSRGGGATIGAILVYVACNFAFAFFLYVGFIKSVPRDIDEAAIIDGTSPLRLFAQIIFPLLKPATATVLISTAMSVWNDFTVALYLLNDASRSTAVLSTYLFMGQKTSNWNLLFADVVLVSLPIVLFYLSVQKNIVSGLTAGAVKG